MSLFDLTAEQVEELLENYGWPRAGHEETERYRDGFNYKSRKTGRYIEATTQSIEQGATWDEFEYTPEEGIRIEGLGTVFLEKQHGGEGEGDDYYIVLKIVDGETVRFFKKPGWYASYDGGYLDGDLFEVKAVERTVTFWE